VIPNLLLKGATFGDPPLDEMPYERPLFTPSQVNRAGRLLVAAPDTYAEMTEEEEREVYGALAIIHNWRAAHAYPLNAIYVTLANKAKRVDGQANAAQRLKRLASILDKLFRSGTMTVSQMQDIGGCRAVVSNCDKLNSLVSSYQSRPIKSEFVHK
jgi:hypothetical protein